MNGGDDVLYASYIDTGPDGVCQSLANNLDPLGDDGNPIPVNQGRPYQVCVSPGADGYRDTVNGGDDTITGQSITTGPDGISNTAADDTDDPAPSTPPAASLESGLNDIWGQACVEFQVYQCGDQINYDFDCDNLLLCGSTDLSIEENAVQSAKSPLADINVYYVPDTTSPTAVAYVWPSAPHEVFVFTLHRNSPQTEAHECGHCADLGTLPDRGTDDGNERLMFWIGVPWYSRLVKAEWDMAH